ncbi:MAG: hypothetical protein IPK60_11220 [Sandaracinaceae bacterium]|nr:hypothetical protein [Sandaracinaceae bacterium]
MQTKYGVVLLLSVLSATRCRIQARGFYDPPPPATVTVQAGVQAPAGSVQVVGTGPQMGAGVTVIEATCVQGGQEQCNGIDDNCNGVVDEGCGYQTGAIQITSAWNTGADIDMYVTDPSGEELSYSHTTSSSGGMLDHDARGQCVQAQNNTVENVFWNTPQPPHGTYTVALHYYSDCNVNAGPTPTVVSIAVGGRIIGQYQIVLQPTGSGGPHVTVATFTI